MLVRVRARVIYESTWNVCNYFAMNNIIVRVSHARGPIYHSNGENMQLYAMIFSVSPRADRPAWEERVGYSAIGVSLGDMGGF